MYFLAFCCSCIMQSTVNWPHVQTKYTNKIYFEEPTALNVASVYN